MQTRALAVIEHRGEGGGADLWVLGRRVLRLTRRQARLVYGRMVTPLFAHHDGSRVRESEAPGMRRWLKLAGVLVCTDTGTAMLHWRGWESDARR